MYEEYLQYLFLQILRQWISLDYRPAYIIFEHIHKQEPIRVTIDYLDTHDYRYIGTLGWNIIFEHSSEKNQ